ncbi:GerAB/ArcD/ProY family transporter [Clostridium algidicarnis]|uniref:Spore germination protein (Amino acid permease) n=2 Tax=Clostridium algidicarnis TaxID=37659 RepID=A0A2S6FZK3_9CLOT|nr:endospore germination permease [Clostridium algidicarnis]MBB6631017.1 endospore germination permease [Clostridium algidicarnis]MBB6698194.1 endospore germination permease [Clostridium algidicarnis]MBU3194235.1 spore germination protein [Clostridium algidicarnis]MBU3197164.1 spore germination protein [Clostridium algidicarnis]MBU3205943.1 spore germination protein [Clostridium algidicarnis]
MDSNKKIRSYGLFSTLVCTVIGVGIFSYPRELAENVNNEGWIISILSGGVYMVIAYMIYKICKLNEFKEFQEVAKGNMGIVFGTLILMFYSAYMLILSSTQMRNFVEVMKKYMLEKTPTEFLLLVTIITGAYIVRGGINNLVRFNEISFLIMFIPCIFIFLILLKNSDFTNMLPVFQQKPFDYIKALLQSLVSFAGIEMMFLLLPLAENKISAKKSVLKAVGFTTIFYTLINIFCLAILSKEQTKRILWPTITMVTSIDFPGLFVERWEGVIMGLWILFYFTTFVNLYYFSCYIISDVFKLKDIKLSVLITTPFIYIIAIFPGSVYTLNTFIMSVLRILIFTSMLLFPLLFYIVTTIKIRRKESNK